MLLQAKKNGMDPQALKDRPELPWYLQMYIDDFYRLCRYRTSGMNSVNPLDLNTILLYTEVYSVKNVQYFIEVMNLLDTMYTTHLQKK